MRGVSVDSRSGLGWMGRGKGMDGGGEGMEWLCGADKRWMCTQEKVGRKK